jgi:hypothetical protein
LRTSANATGAYDEEESAARAYDLAALKYWGTSTFTNFPVKITAVYLIKKIIIFYENFLFDTC